VCFGHYVVFELQMSYGHCAIFVSGIYLLGNALAGGVLQDLLLNAANVILKISHNLFPLFHFVFHDFGVLHLKLFVLFTVLSSNHFKLLAHQV